MGSFQLSEAASGDLDALYLYGILNHGLAQADLYYDGLIEKFDLLSTHPSWGADYTAITPNLRRYEYGSHSIYYQICGDQILIVRVLGFRQDPARHF